MLRQYCHAILCLPCNGGALRWNGVVVRGQTLADGRPIHDKFPTIAPGFAQQIVLDSPSTLLYSEQRVKVSAVLPGYFLLGSRAIDAI